MVDTPAFRCGCVVSNSKSVKLTQVAIDSHRYNLALCALVQVATKGSAKLLHLNCRPVKTSLFC